jgi:hypothetical protein
MNAERQQFGDLTPVYGFVLSPERAFAGADVSKSAETPQELTPDAVPVQSSGHVSSSKDLDSSDVARVGTPDVRLRHPGLVFVRTSVFQLQAALRPEQIDHSCSQLSGFLIELSANILGAMNALVFPMFSPLRDKEPGSGESPGSSLWTFWGTFVQMGYIAETSLVEHFFSH